MIGDIWTIRPCLFDGTQLSLNVLYYQVTAQAGLGATAQQIADDADASFAASIKAAAADTATYLGCLAQRVLPLPVGVVGKGTTNTGAGTGGAICMPRQVAGLISKNTAQGGRRGRGHAYIGFVPVAAVQGDGAPTAAYLLLLADIATIISTPLSSGGGGNTSVLTPGIYSKKFTGFFPYTLVGRETAFATQRRRGAYGRPNISPF